MAPRTDIIISLHATRQFPAESLFLNCIERLKQHTTDYRLILVDDACDETAEKVISDVAKQYQCVLIKTNKQRMFTRAYNAGLRMARTPWVVVLNADTEPEGGWLDEMYSVRDEFEAQSGKRCGLVGSLHTPHFPARWQEAHPPSYVTGHCWLVNMQALYDVSAARGTPGIYLDELSQQCIHIRSDVTLSWDMHKLGWSPLISYKSAVGHYGGRSWGYDVAKVDSLKLSDVDW